MKLEDLKAMNLSKLERIEIESQASDPTKTNNRCLGYFKGIETEKMRDGGEHFVLTYYDSPDGPHRIPTMYGSEPIDEIQCVTILVPKEESVS